MSRTLTRKFSRSLWSLFSVFFLKMSLCPEYDTLLLTPLARWPTLSPPRGRGPGWGPSTSGALTPPWPPSSAWSPSSSSSSPSCAQSASTSSSGQTASGRRWEVEDEYCHLLSSVVRLMILSSYFKTFNQFPRNFEGRNYEQTLTMQINLLKHSLLSSLGEFYWNKRRIIFFPVIWFKSLPSKQFTRNGWYLFSVFTKHIVYW